MTRQILHPLFWMLCCFYRKAKHEIRNSQNSHPSMDPFIIRTAHPRESWITWHFSSNTTYNIVFAWLKGLRQFKGGDTIRFVTITGFGEHEQVVVLLNLASPMLFYFFNDSSVTFAHPSELALWLQHCVVVFFCGDSTLMSCGPFCFFRPTELTFPSANLPFFFPVYQLL